MFKQAERLNRAAFTEYFKTGRRFQTPNLTLIYTSKAPFQTSAVVGKKVAKGAVDRNRIRRRLYTALRRCRDDVSIATGVYIIIAKPTAAKATRAALYEEVELLLSLAYPLKSR